MTYENLIQVAGSRYFIEGELSFRISSGDSQIVYADLWPFDPVKKDWRQKRLVGSFDLEHLEKSEKISDGLPDYILRLHPLTVFDDSMGRGFITEFIENRMFRDLVLGRPQIITNKDGRIAENSEYPYAVL